MERRKNWRRLRESLRQHHFLLFGKAGRDLTFNTTVILSSQNLDVSVISPIRIPAVGNEPVRSVIFNSPTQNADRVSTKGLAVQMLIDTCAPEKWNRHISTHYSVFFKFYQVPDL